MASRLDKFIMFYLGKQKYALPTLSFNQFIEFSEPTAVFQMDKCIQGLIYHNGHIITIIDIRKKLKIKYSKKTNTCLTFELDGYYYGLLVDKGDETLAVKKIVNDRKRKAFKKYFRDANKEKVYILEEQEILSQLGIYD